MMYPFMTLNDQTEILHSEYLFDGTVKVYIERPDEKDCFHDMTVYLPEYKIESIHGFSDRDVNRFMDIIKSTAHLILQFSQEGGFEHASSF